MHQIHPKLVDLGQSFFGKPAKKRFFAKNVVFEVFIREGFVLTHLTFNQAKNFQKFCFYYIGYELLEIDEKMLCLIYLFILFSLIFFFFSFFSKNWSYISLICTALFNCSLYYSIRIFGPNFRNVKFNNNKFFLFQRCLFLTLSVGE